jgi:hypothetical protein
LQIFDLQSILVLPEMSDLAASGGHQFPALAEFTIGAIEIEPVTTSV